MTPVFLYGSRNSRDTKIENGNKKQVFKQKCIGCQTSIDVVNGLCSQCFSWIKIRKYCLAIKSLLNKVGGHNGCN